MTAQTQPTTQEQINDVLDRMTRITCWADAFVLGFVGCNSARQQEDVRRQFLTRLEDKHVTEITLAEPIVSLLDVVAPQVDAANPPDVVCVYGLEHSLVEQGADSPVLGRLNHDRDLLRRAVPTVLLIWLPDYAMDMIAKGSPDFWAWRSGTYEFPTDVLLWKEEATQVLEQDDNILSQSVSAKNRRIFQFESLLRSMSASTKSQLQEAETCLLLRFRLILIYSVINSWANVQRHIAMCMLETSQVNLQTDNPNILILSLVNQMVDILKEGEDNPILVREGSKVDALNRLANGAITTAFMSGVDTLEHGDKENYLRKIFEQHKKNGNIVEMCAVARFLSECYSNEARLVDAVELYLQLENECFVAKDILHLADVKSQLARLYLLKGAWLEAEKLLQQSWRLYHSIGDRSGAALDLNQLADVQMKQGMFLPAVRSKVHAWTLAKSVHFVLADTLSKSFVSVRHQSEAKEQIHQVCGRDASHAIAVMSGQAEANPEVLERLIAHFTEADQNADEVNVQTPS